MSDTFIILVLHTCVETAECQPDIGLKGNHYIHKIIIMSKKTVNNNDFYIDFMHKNIIY